MVFQYHRANSQCYHISPTKVCSPRGAGYPENPLILLIMIQTENKNNQCPNSLSNA